MPSAAHTRYEECDNPRAIKSFERGNRLIQDGELRAATTELRRAVDLCPKNVLYHIYYQDIAHRLPPVAGPVGEEEQVPDPATVAMRRYYAAYRDDGRSPLAPYFAARLQRLDRREAPAQDLLAEALRRDPAFYFAHLERGLIWLGVGRPSAAVNHLRNALDSRPACLEARRVLAECYVELLEWNAAAEQYAKYVAGRPDDRAARRAYLTLITHHVDGRLDEAAKLVGELLQQSPDDLSLHMDRAAVYWRQGALDRALQTYRFILQRDPKHARAALNLGNLHYEIGRSKRGDERRVPWTKARLAYRYFRELAEYADGYDWFDLNFAVPYRLREIDAALGVAAAGPVDWRDL